MSEPRRRPLSASVGHDSRLDRGGARAVTRSHEPRPGLPDVEDRSGGLDAGDGDDRRRAQRDQHSRPHEFAIVWEARRLAAQISLADAVRPVAGNIVAELDDADGANLLIWPLTVAALGSLDIDA